jgi:hypothetical protein
MHNTMIGDPTGVTDPWTSLCEAYKCGFDYSLDFSITSLEYKVMVD